LKAVADASSLIHPAKVPRFWKLMKETFEEILIPEAVWKEILKGKEIMSPDVPVIEEAIKAGWIKVRKLKSKARLAEGLGEGEKEAIALMKEHGRKVDWLLIDDKIASTRARLMGLSVRSAMYLLIYWERKGMTKESQSLQMLDDMVKADYYLSSEDYVAVKELITRPPVS